MPSRASGPSPVRPACASCASCAVRDEALCAAVDDIDGSALHAIARRRTVPAGQILVWAGDPNAICATIVSGLLKIVRVGAGGREQIVGLSFRGDFVGDVFAETARDTVQMVSDAELCVYPRAALQGAFEDHPAIERMLLHRAIGTLDDARMWMLMLGRMDAGSRVATLLVAMARRMGNADGGRFDLPMSRSEIAALLGMTIETVSRQITGLRAAGIIALPGGRGVEIRDHAGLARLAAG